VKPRIRPGEKRPGEKPRKSARPHIHRLPAGAAAYVFEEATRRRVAEERIVAGLREAGYREAIVPSADYLAPYLSHLGPREERELYRFVDRHGDTLALRADFTIALARHLAPRLTSSGPAARVFYRGEVLRGGARDGAGAEFYQVGAELLGEPSSSADEEIVERCLAALQATGARRTHLVLSAVGALEELLAPEASGDRLRDLAGAVRERRLSEASRMAGVVSLEFSRRVRRLLEGDLAPEDCGLERLGRSGEALTRVARAVTGQRGCRVAIDVAEPPSRSYYTGFFFSVYGEVGGRPIAAGGRYDGLYAAFGSPRPAVGFALGLEGALGEAE
jgi:ATP phosphoribosyltransferase regulatory subunit